MRTKGATLAAALKAEIPGLTVDIGYSIALEATLLHTRYTCPCGEISGLVIALYDETDPRAARLTIEDIKSKLREHVRGEGNEPNF